MRGFKEAGINRLSIGIQTFDDDYELCGDFRDQWRQVGNAVPVKMANIVAVAIREQYFKEG